MQYPSSLLLPAVILVSSVGAAVVCAVLVWYGPVPECDEQPGRAHRRRLVTRVAHAGALVCFVLTTMLAVVGLGPPAREAAPTATGQEIAGDDSPLALGRQATDVRAQLAELDARLTELDSRAHAGAFGDRALARRHAADVAVTRASRHRGRSGAVAGAARPAALASTAPVTAESASREPATVGPSTTDPASSSPGARRSSTATVELAPPSPESRPATAVASEPTRRVPDASAPMLPALPESGTAAQPGPAERARRWLAGEAQEMRQTVRAEIQDARRRLDRLVEWFRKFPTDTGDGQRRQPE